MNVWIYDELPATHADGEYLISDPVLAATEDGSVAVMRYVEDKDNEQTCWSGVESGMEYHGVERWMPIPLTEKEKIREYGEVFTPQRIVVDMCDMVEAEAPLLPETTVLEPTCGDGVFVLEVLRRKFAQCKKRKDYTTALDTTWAMEIQADNVEKTIANVTALCEQYFKPTQKEREIISDRVIQADSLKVMKLLNWLEGTP